MRLSARTQVAIGVIEYAILIVLAVWGLSWVLGHHAGTFGITASWFSLHGIGGKGSLAAGFLITVFMYSGWDGTVYVNEEVRHRSRNPGRAAIAAVAITGVLLSWPRQECRASSRRPGYRPTARRGWCT